MRAPIFFQVVATCKTTVQPATLPPVVVSNHKKLQLKMKYLVFFSTILLLVSVCLGQACFTVFCIIPAIKFANKVHVFILQSTMHYVLKGILFSNYSAKKLPRPSRMHIYQDSPIYQYAVHSLRLKLVYHVYNISMHVNDEFDLI